MSQNDILKTKERLINSSYYILLLNERAVPPPYGLSNSNPLAMFIFLRKVNKMDELPDQFV